MAKRTNKIQQEEIVEETVESIPAEKKIIYGIATVRVNVRQEAKIEASVVSILDKGQEVVVLDKEPVNGFIKTENGYVMKDYLKVEE